MKRRIALVSVATTAFSLVIMTSVIYGYRVSAGSRSAPSAVSETQQSAVMVAAGSMPSVSISPQEAAAVAAQFLNRTDPYSVQRAEYDRERSYEVTFPSGDVVYVSLEGVVLGSVPGPVQMVYSNSSERERDEGGGGQGSAQGTDGEDAGEDESEHDGEDAGEDEPEHEVEDSSEDEPEHDSEAG